MSLSIYTYRVPMYFCLYPFPLIESTCVTWSVMGLKGNFMTNLLATTEVKANNFICIWVSNNCRIISRLKRLSHLRRLLKQFSSSFFFFLHTFFWKSCFLCFRVTYELLDILGCLGHAWVCLFACFRVVLHGLAWFRMVSHGLAWFHVISCSCMRYSVVCSFA